MSSRLVVGGRHVAEVAAAVGRLRRLWATPQAAVGLDLEPPPRILSPQELRRRFGAEARQGIVAEIELPSPVEPDALVAAAERTGRPLLVLAGVQDPQNLGSILRAAAALGAAGIVRPKRRSVGWTPAVVRASVGTLYAVPMAIVPGVAGWLGRLSDATPTVALVPSGGRPLWEVELAGALVILGAEGAGVPRLVRERCRTLATIPLVAAESLNVAQTAVAVLYEAARRRGVATRGNEV